MAGGGKEGLAGDAQKQNRREKSLAHPKSRVRQRFAASKLQVRVEFAPG
ncbi:hypothetical protein [Arthrobacter sp. 9AX]|nr:hypothetical protein [Arthrobacter sp. 9AX]